MTSLLTTPLPSVPSSETAVDPKVEVVELPERFDTHQIEWFDRLIDESANVGATIAVDAGRVRFMDNEALQALIDTRLKQLDLGRDLAAIRPSVAFRVTLELTGSDTLLPLDTGSSETMSSDQMRSATAETVPARW